MGCWYTNIELMNAPLWHTNTKGANTTDHAQTPTIPSVQLLASKTKHAVATLCEAITGVV